MSTAYVNRIWREEDGYWALDFCNYDSCDEVLRIFHDKEDETYWLISSGLLNIEYDFLLANTLDEAKEESEQMYTDHLEDMHQFYKELLEKWEETQ